MLIDLQDFAYYKILHIFATENQPPTDYLKLDFITIFNIIKLFTFV